MSRLVRTLIFTFVLALSSVSMAAPTYKYQFFPTEEICINEDDEYNFCSNFSGYEALKGLSYSLTAEGAALNQGLITILPGVPYEVIGVSSFTITEFGHTTDILAEPDAFNMIHTLYGDFNRNGAVFHLIYSTIEMWMGFGSPFGYANHVGWAGVEESSGSTYVSFAGEWRPIGIQYPVGTVSEPGILHLLLLSLALGAPVVIRQSLFSKRVNQR